jgi:acyl CoA:acetate/3-ketoacid CoA transferase beta subunit
MTGEEIVAISNMGRNNGMSAFEQVEVARHASKRASNTSITGLAIGVGAVAIGVGAWICNSLTSRAMARGNERSIDILANGLLAERSERNAYTLANNPTLKAYIDVATGGASAGANAGATSNATVAQLLELVSRNNGNVCPTPVSLWNPATPRVDRGCCEQ